MKSNQYETLVEALEGLKKRGFTANFEIREDRLHDLDSERHYTADALEISEFHRFEGMSNPGDMSIVYGIRAEDGNRGCLVRNFSSKDIGGEAFIKKIKMNREA